MYELVHFASTSKAHLYKHHQQLVSPSEAPAIKQMGEDNTLAGAIKLDEDQGSDLPSVNPQIATSTPAHPEAQDSCWNLTNAATRKIIPLNAVVHHTNANAVPTYNEITEYDEGRG
ncbi:hypothetical protein SUNI508_01874 [Seiridium unicorne]|uniref:Uncharacterized protein n=1 Tax=Seiridium unicorne TaxID=138068 RepID=A0ABR2UPI1_9PEZI